MNYLTKKEAVKLYTQSLNILLGLDAFKKTSVEKMQLLWEDYILLLVNIGMISDHQADIWITE